MGSTLLVYFPTFITVLLVLFAIALAWLVIDIVRRKKIGAKRMEELILLEVRVPKEAARKEDEPLQDFKTYTAFAEQLFSSFASFYDTKIASLWYGQPVFSFEIIAKNKEIIFFVGAPKPLREALEKQILSFYPTAQIEPSSDFKIFGDNLKASVGVLSLNKQFIYPLKTFTELGADPLSSITNTLSRLGEGNRAGIQILIRPHKGGWRTAVSQAVSQIQAGKTVSSSSNYLVRGVNQALTASQKDLTKEDVAISPLQESQIQLIQKKGEKVGFDTQIRIISLAPEENAAKEQVRNIFSSFAQFGSPDRNSFSIKFPYNIQRYLPYYILRHFTRRHVMLLNAEELASIFHLPNYTIETPGIRWFLAKRAIAPNNMPTEGLVLGENIFRGEKQTVRIKTDDRRRHLYSIGMTGTGKTTLFESMILQDIREGRGVGFFDPHGDAVDSLLGKIPQNRMEDVIVFDPSDRDRPFGLNLLEWKTPEQKDFLVQETVQIFYKLFDPNNQGFIGPQFEHWMRNAALTLMESEGGGTLIEMPRLFVDEEFRNRKIAQLKDNVVKAFWEKQLAQTADFHKSEMYNYFISKFGRFMTNDMMRNIMGQAQSSFDLREIMDNKKILLVNLSKGQVGEVNSNLLGMIMVAKIFTAALARQKDDTEQRQDFYLYVDEFQNFATDTFKSILSEARKYHLNLNITNQYIAQLPEDIRDAIIGNVGTIISFRIGVPDAEFMAHEYAPVFNEKDLNNIEAFNCYVKLLIDNTPSRPFSMRTIKDSTVEDDKTRDAVKRLSAMKYGRDKMTVEREVSERTKSTAPSGPEMKPPAPVLK